MLVNDILTLALSRDIKSPLVEIFSKLEVDGAVGEVFGGL